MRREAEREHALSDELSDALRSSIEARKVSLSRLRMLQKTCDAVKYLQYYKISAMNI